jgi:hypothetical protein
MNSKDLLAKLLATEDLTVLHQNAQTASFNTETRTLTLPMWKEMTSETYDHLVGHEVGHALYTPNKDWGSAVENNTKAFRSFLNVVEDARIEKLIQRRYPGLRRSFIASYKKMLKDGMFGGDIDEINNMKLIDRINTFFKCGATVGVDFAAEELAWVKEIETIETFDDAIDVATRLYESELAKKEEDDEFDGLDENGDLDFPDEDEDDIESSSGFDGEDNDDEGEEVETEDEVEMMEGDGGKEEDEDLTSVTDNELNKNINNEFNDASGTDVNNVLLNSSDVSSLVVPYGKVIEEWTGWYNYQVEYLTATYGTNANYSLDRLGLDNYDQNYKDFINNNRKTINYLVKEFEMKKSAAEYTRAAESKTGVLDAVKMHSYKYNDDIFKKVTVVPEGKNHGMIMYLDWSGSMWSDMKATIDQLLNLVHFCRQVNIPFRVYAFTDGYAVESESVKGNGLLMGEVADKTTFYHENFRYIEFFHDKMRKKDFVEMSKILLNFGRNTDVCPPQFRLHATPLDTAIMGASFLHDKFLKQTRVDIVNTIILTDGESHSAVFRKENENYDYGEDIRMLSYGYRYKNSINTIIDPLTKKNYRVRNNMSNGAWTDLFLKIYRERTGSTVIGFRILPTTLSKIRYELRYAQLNDHVLRDLAKEIRKENYVKIPTTGYTKYFALAGGSNLQTSNGSFEVAEDATVAQMRRAFQKANKNRVGSRALLNEFVKEVA